ncbi:putative integral membrane proteinase [Aurantiacibacter atlanticus]|uniref:Putative integral membrane proteinase n=1 Tax=Aurantiacibacter atlanticus TaxID=1648404 RepID=A0A0H4W0T4_9SPHN|nr:protease modulator HflK [Aurantiacibacter atlanticus]AKQ43128.2 putative integral membrane proteinase [Aurantiacibacter atlanticus]MDF1834620.1 protease modulator HflK [Alteraurantiacibacter sp. bin_em_oilr2.035]
MERLGGFFESIGLAMAGKRNPWGKPSASGGGDGGNGSGDGPGDGGGDGDTPSSSGGDGPRNPWLPGGGGDSDRGRRSANIEDIFRNRGPEGPRRGGPGGPNMRFPERPGGGSWFPIAMVAIVAVWFFATSVHFVQPREQGVVTWLGGQYSRTMDPGTELTLPWPLQTVEITDVSEIRLEEIGAGGEKLILTGDQNLVDLSYLVRWNISDLVQYQFQLAEPDETVREVAESAMRESIAETDLDRVLSGAGRAQVEARVRQRMQSILDSYGSGIAVQGVEIARTEAPEQVIEAFNDVLAARQDRERELNQARRYEQQLLAGAQGSAAEFNEIYAQYRLAPEVTQRRLYYETMEQVLRGTDKTIVEPSGVTPYLPLPEVRRRSQNAASAPSLTVTPQGGQ